MSDVQTQPAQIQIPQTRLERAKRHVQMAGNIVTSQESLVAQLRASGQCTMQADILLNNFKMSLALFKADLDRFK